MNEVLEILSHALEEGQSTKEITKFENLDSLYAFCVKNGYKGDKAKFEKEYAESVKFCAESLKISQISDADLDSVAGGINLNKSFKSGMAVLMTALSLSGSSSGIASAKIDDFQRNKIKNIAITAGTFGAPALGLGAIAGSLLTTIIFSGLQDDAHYVLLLPRTLKLVDCLARSENNQTPKFDSLQENKKIDLLQKAYDEIDIKLFDHKTHPLTSEEVRKDLLAKVKNKISSLEKLKDSQSIDKVKVLKIVVLALNSASTPAALAKNLTNGQLPLPSTTPGVPATSLTPPPPPPPPPATDLAHHVKTPKVLTEDERQQVDSWTKRANDLIKQAEDQLALARRYAEKFNNNKVHKDTADTLVAETQAKVNEVRRYAEIIIKSANSGNFDHANDAFSRAQESLKETKQKANAVHGADMVARNLANQNIAGAILAQRNKIISKNNNN